MNSRDDEQAGSRSGSSGRTVTADSGGGHSGFVASAGFPPQEIEEYYLRDMLGHGAMGTVYLAHDRLLDRPVAIKFVNRPDPERNERFLNEARAMARFQHSNIATIYRIGELESRHYIVSEYIRGTSLDKLDKPIPWQRAAKIALDLARGLAAAHRRNVLHRDIKPGNAILAESDEAKLLDFGLAKFIDGTPQNPPAPDREDPTAPRWSNTGENPPLEPFGSPSLGDGGPVGTPYYIAPEVWREGAEAASERSDVYSFGALLFELCAGYTPHHFVPLGLLGRVVNEKDAPRVSELEPDVDRRLEAIIARCLARDPGERYPSGEAVRDALDKLLSADQVVTLPPGNPYRGLLPFDAEHRALFFGRAGESREVIERLCSDPLVLVAGESGVGKSSLIRAGVLPGIAENALREGRRWKTCRMVPGARPLEALIALLAERLEVSENIVGKALEEDPGAAARLLRDVHGRSAGTVIFIDQLEELVTLSDPELAEYTSEILACLAERIPGLRLLATVRGDQVARVAGLPGLGAHVERSLYLLRPLGEDAIREAIVGPANATGIEFGSRDLVDTLVATTARSEGSMPLLQFALAELWEKRDAERGIIPDAALDQIGGVKGALSRHADSVLAEMVPATRVAARRIMTRLVTSYGTRARQTARELASDDETHGNALAALVKGRLLVVREVDGQPSYEIAHEALIRDWTTLRGWLDKEGSRKAVKERIAQAATHWDRLGRTSDALWHGKLLDETGDIDLAELAATESAFLRAARRLAWRRTWQRRLAVAMIVLAGVSVYAVLRYRDIRDADRARRQRDYQVDVHMAEASRRLEQVRARQDEFLEARDAAFAAYRRLDIDKGEAAWKTALDRAAELDSAFQSASQPLERALEIDSRRDDVRSLLAGTLFERALLAEKEGHTAARDAFVERLALYDAGGVFTARWQTKTRVVLETSPVQANAHLYQYQLDDKGMLETVRIDQNVLTPASWNLEPGSYLLVLSTRDTVEVRYPFLVERTAQATPPFRLHVDLPPRGAIPEGFIYIPAGSFIYGYGKNRDEEPFRDWYGTLPTHTRSTGAYAIARHETTYAEWIEFLRTLTPAERARRLSRAGIGYAELHNELKELGNDFELRIGFDSVEYHARIDQPIHYQQRTRHNIQDWSRFPVTGISIEDAEAYVSWLDRSGRVPGAHVCRDDEWERAARGADDRLYPHGYRVRPDDANFDLTYDRKSFGPDEVGTHAVSTSPFGLQDMAGNAYELVVSIHDARNLVLRGGSYYYDQLTCASVNRGAFSKVSRDSRVGLRICATVCQPGASCSHGAAQ